MAAASANVTGSTSQFALNATLGYLQAEGAKLVKQLADSLPRGAESETVRAALHGVLACGSAAAQGAACGSGAAGASLSSVLGYMLEPRPGASAEEVESGPRLTIRDQYAHHNEMRTDVINQLEGRATLVSQNFWASICGFVRSGQTAIDAGVQRGATNARYRIHPVDGVLLRHAKSS